ncbi:MAG: hypothetical protein HY593_00235 [Candidatus Omnitrophica bacterium]|nr:hypothetical protein [Candidatus Omnitrophota bacterium]
MRKRSAFTLSRVHAEAEQWHSGRVDLLRRIERYFQKRILVFQTSFFFDNGLITDGDAAMLEEVLLSSKIRDNLLLLINSSGGFGLAAERIIRVCRKYSKSGFEVLVPHMAKSAATLVCLGSKKVWLGETSELGPVDPQLAVQNRRISVHNIIKNYDRLLSRAALAKGRIEPYLQQLSVYDPRTIEQLRQELKLSEEMSIRLLRTGMMKGQGEKAIRTLIRVFIDPEETLQHGRPIYHERAKDCGIIIGTLGLDNPIWNAIWELQLRYDHVLNRAYGKLFEAVGSSFTMPGYRSSAGEPVPCLEEMKWAEQNLGEGSRLLPGNGRKCLSY